MKHILLAALITGLLSACTVGTPGMSVGVGVGTNIGRHVGLGTSINIPVGLERTRSSKTTGGINAIKEQIITHFDAKGNTSNQAVKGGFYRQLISKHGNEYIVQDFYGDNGKKRTDPYTLPRNRLLDFRAHPVDGTLTTYAYNGNVMQQQVYQNDKLISARY
ncbi:NemA protein [Neisseria animaloris]|uniref:NemA protein n=1 Tax=Neisseria animaloris TaxID=326522 RepID=A0A3S5BVK1_9NEIS|nr:NemA protein [Neisseria animaloris]VEJ21169.1 Uncharacterised protein [Neisseria animaloris]